MMDCSLVAIRRGLSLSLSNNVVFIFLLVAGTVDKDPWGLRSGEVKRNWEKMKCPPLEMFKWRRVVVDEFTYARV